MYASFCILIIGHEYPTLWHEKDTVFSIVFVKEDDVEVKVMNVLFRNVIASTNYQYQKDDSSAPKSPNYIKTRNVNKRFLKKKKRKNWKYEMKEDHANKICMKKNKE